MFNFLLTMKEPASLRRPSTQRENLKYIQMFKIQKLPQRVAACCCLLLWAIIPQPISNQEQFDLISQNVVTDSMRSFRKHLPFWGISAKLSWKCINCYNCVFVLVMWSTSAIRHSGSMLTFVKSIKFLQYKMYWSISVAIFFFDWFVLILIIKNYVPPNYILIILNLLILIDLQFYCLNY